ncbi:hypothetical protein, partial [Streptomyces acidiscabies]|uniref:hypothetical protein n=1 Tax=Streptomyces acidiscabies TaxID=42234 RepID=UPI001C4C51EA
FGRAEVGRYVVEGHQPEGSAHGVQVEPGQPAQRRVRVCRVRGPGWGGVEWDAGTWGGWRARAGGGD